MWIRKQDGKEGASLQGYYVSPGRKLKVIRRDGKNGNMCEKLRQ